MIPYQPWARTFRDLLIVNHRKPTKPEYLDPVARGFQEGMPRINWQGVCEIVQEKDQIVFLHDYFHIFRVIAMDGRPPLPEDVKLWMGQPLRSLGGKHPRGGRRQLERPELD